VEDEYSELLVEGGCIAPLVGMLSGSAGEIEAAAGALANVAYDQESRKAIASAGAIGTNLPTSPLPPQTRMEVIVT
jgi:hypothetical protein